MGKAYYYDSIIPPKDWLIYASLVWDKVWLNPSALLLTESYAPEMLVNSDGAFLYDLMTKTTILDTSIPATDRNLLSQDENQRFVEYLNRGSHILQSILDEPDPVVKYDRPTYQQFVELLSLGNKALTPSWAQR